MPNSHKATLLLCLIASAWLLLPLATRAIAADDAMTWQFSESSDSASGGRMTARLIYGVPETDNVQVSGVCEAKGGVAVSRITFGADIGDLQDGKETELRLSGGGFDHALKGTIHRTAAEEGLSGVAVDLTPDDPLWGAMADKTSLDYLVPGYKASSLDFERGRDKIQQFALACRSAASADQDHKPGDAKSAESAEAEKEAFDNAKELGTVEAFEAFIDNYPSGFHADLARAYIKKLGTTDTSASGDNAPSVSAMVGPDPSCEDRAKLSSQSKDTKTKITFINKSGAYRGIMWIDSKGDPKTFANLNSGEQVTLDTYANHAWMVTDGPGNCLRLVLSHASDRVVELTGGNAVKAVKTAPAKTAPAKPEPAKTAPAKPVAKPKTTKVTGCEEGLKLVNGKCKRIAASEPAQGCPPGTKPVPETDNCVPIATGSTSSTSTNTNTLLTTPTTTTPATKTKKSGCGKGQIKVDGNCIAKQDAASYCGPGYRLKGNKCVQGYAAPKPQIQLPTWQLKGIAKGCPPGQDWNAAEGCHEND